MLEVNGAFAGVLENAGFSARQFIGGIAREGVTAHAAEMLPAIRLVRVATQSPAFS